MSDHNLVGMIIKKNNRKFIPRMVYKRNYAKYDIESFKKDLRNQPWTQVTNEASASSGWSTFKRLLTNVIDKHAPLVQKKIRGRDCPWLANEIRHKMNERDFLLRKARKAGEENDWSMYRRLRNLVTRSIRYSKATHTRKILQENIDRPKKFWDKIERCPPTKSKNQQILDYFK